MAAERFKNYFWQIFYGSLSGEEKIVTITWKIF